MPPTPRDAFGPETTTDEVLEGIDLTGRRALVTGGSSGLGAETARALASKGASVVLTAPIDALYAATEVNERAFEAATESGRFDFEATVARLRETIADEVNPGLLALRAAAHKQAQRDQTIGPRADPSHGEGR